NRRDDEHDKTYPPVARANLLGRTSFLWITRHARLSEYFRDRRLPGSERRYRAPKEPDNSPTTALLDGGRVLERVERRRARHRPLESRCAVPRLVARLFEFAAATVGRQRDREQEVHLRKTEAERADRDDLVPVGELCRVVRVAARHACETNEVHRQER